MQTYISGCLTTKHAGANTLDISAGAAYVPAAGKIVTYAGGSAVSPGTLGASQRGQVYLNADGSITASPNTDPPSTTYAGTARKDSSGRRWLGPYVTDASSNLYDVVVNELGGSALEVFYNSAASLSPFRIVSGGTNSSFGSISSFVAVVPRYAAVAALLVVTLDNTSAGVVNCYLSTDGTNINAAQFCTYVTAASMFPAITVWSPIERATPGIYYKALGSAYIDVSGYRMTR
jgi:hypothetical protein